MGASRIRHARLRKSSGKAQEKPRGRVADRILPDATMEAALTNSDEVRGALRTEASDARATASRRFFKTGVGGYSEGDLFLGVTVPRQRAIAKRALALPDHAMKSLLDSPWHEERLVALVVLVQRYESGNTQEKECTARYYRAHFSAVNNWDLVDLSAWQILGRQLRASGGPFLETLKSLAESPRLWDRRIAMVSTFAWTKEGDAGPALTVARTLLGDNEDLMHKAVGWMLREVGKRVSRDVLSAFLQETYAQLPRTTLRYAIEHFSADERRAWLTLPHLGRPVTRFSALGRSALWRPR